MDFRHEWKYEISYCDLLVLRQRLRAITKADIHAPNGCYQIRSLYFDDLFDSALREKINGVGKREKFRIRYYNGDISYISLEKKQKVNGLCRKITEPLSAEEAQAIAAGNYVWMMGSGRPLVQELYLKIQSKGLRPKTVVDYTREPFVYPFGNVRVTLDYDIRTGIQCTDFLNPRCVTIPAGEAPIILEVKWDEYLPAVIRDAVWLKDRRAGAFSKYAACRIYG